MATSCDIEITVTLDDLYITAECGDDIEIFIEEEIVVEVEAFDYPRAIDLLNERVVAVEEIAESTSILAQAAGQAASEAVQAVNEIEEYVNNLNIPTKTSDLENDSGYIVLGDVRKLLVNYTSQQNLAAIDITTDLKNAALNVPIGKRLLITFNHTLVNSSGSNVDSTTIWHINNITGSVYRWSSVITTSLQPQASNRCIHYSFMNIDIESISTGIMGGEFETTGGTKASSIAHFTLVQTIGAFTSLKITAAGGNLIKSGATLKIWEV